MNKKEVAEIRKLFSPDRCSITRICGCYVNAEKEKVATFRQAFLSLEEEEIQKYFDLFKKCLSGTVGRNLINLDFSLACEVEGGSQAFLLSLRDSHLQDDTLIDTFFDKVIASWDMTDNYLILLLHQVYDIPGKASSGDELFDASEDVYDHILCAICPVSLAKSALSYDGDDHQFHSRIRDRIVDKPAAAFLFPAFNDREPDLHSLLYYTAKIDDLHPAFIDEVLGTRVPLSADAQKDAFSTLIVETLGDECGYEVARNLHQQLHEISEQQKEIPDPVSLSKIEVRNLLETSGATPTQMERFDQHFDAAAGEDGCLLAANMMSTKHYEVITPDITIRVSPDRSELIEQRVIDGRACLVIPITDDVTVDGIRVNPSLTSDPK